jgi:hypothetical protein
MNPYGGACRECRDNQLHSPCCRAALLRRSPRTRRHIEEADHVSALPDDLRWKIISHLDCTWAAASMSLVSSNWKASGNASLSLTSTTSHPTHSLQRSIRLPAVCSPTQFPTVMIKHIPYGVKLLNYYSVMLEMPSATLNKRYLNFQ